MASILDDNKTPTLARGGSTTLNEQDQDVDHAMVGPNIRHKPHLYVPTLKGTFCATRTDVKRPTLPSFAPLPRLLPLPVVPFRRDP